MRAGQVIRRFDDLRRNSLPAEVKLELLDQLERQIADDLGSEYQGPLTEDSPLLAEGRGQLYYLQLCARLDFENGDFERQENTLRIFGVLYAEFIASRVRRRSGGGHLKVGGV